MKKITFILFVLYIGLGSLFAQETNDKYQEIDKMNDWGLIITPYALLASQSTDVGGEKIRQSFDDLSSLTNAGFQIIVAARYKRFGLSFDGTFATLGSDVTNSGNIVSTNIDLKIKQNIFDLKLTYFLYDNFEIKGNDVIKGWSLQVGGGGKYWSNDVGINSIITLHRPFQEDEIIENSETIQLEWWDAMVGAKTKFILSDKVMLGINFNVGGFGIGNSSKFAYDFTYINNFRVLDWMSVNAGFRNFYYKRKDDEGTDAELTTKVNVLGPFLGVSFIL